MKKLIKNGLVISPVDEKQADILIDGDKIAAIGAPGSIPATGAEVYDATGKYVLPGLVEPHMHIKAPLGGYVDILDFDSASKCAAFGGVTTFMDFSSTLPGMSLKDAVAQRKAEMEISTLDYSLHCKVVNLATAEDTARAVIADAELARDPGNAEKQAAAKAANAKVDQAIADRLAEIREIIEEGGIPTFKLFLTYRKASVMIDDIYLLKVLKAVKDAGGRVGFHAESNAIAEYNEELFASEGKLNWRDFPDCKGNLCEAEAVSRVLYYARQLDAPIYFFHLSTKESIELVRKAKAEGVDVIAETCGHYLTYTRDMNEDIENGVLYLMSPPLRSAQDQEALWSAVKDGTLSLVTSDNCTFTKEIKIGPLQGGDPDFRKPISGVSGIEERFGLLMNGVNSGKINMQDFVRVACENPARVFGCYPQKGCLQVGSDADIVIVDPEMTFKMDKASLHYPDELEYAQYEGFDTKGCPVTTIRRGEYLVKDRVYNEAASKGRFLKRSLKTENSYPIVPNNK